MWGSYWNFGLRNEGVGNRIDTQHAEKDFGMKDFEGQD